MTRLFDPLTLRDVTFRNRVWLAPMCQYSVDARDGVPTDWHLVHLGARATGGFGLVLTEATAVLPEGRISPQDTGIWSDQQAAAWAPIVRFVQAQGAAFGMQLAHAGRKASTWPSLPGQPRGFVTPEEGGWEVVGPSALASRGLASPHELAVDEIRDVVRAFADAARRCDELGMETVEIHGAHGYLVHQFLSPIANQRTDAYGGDLAGRSRLLREIVEAVRAVWPERKPLLVRLSATDWLDDQPSWTLEQTVSVCRDLRDLGVDLVDVSSGGVASATIPVEPGYQVSFAGTVRREATVPTGAVGLILDGRQAQEILDRGDADAILIGRGALRDPNWPLRAAHELGLTGADAPSWPGQYARGDFASVPQTIPAG